jgi:hypothetical protein
VRCGGGGWGRFHLAGWLIAGILVGLYWYFNPRATKVVSKRCCTFSVLARGKRVHGSEAVSLAPRCRVIMNEAATKMKPQWLHNRQSGLAAYIPVLDYCLLSAYVTAGQILARWRWALRQVITDRLYLRHSFFLESCVRLEEEGGQARSRPLPKGLRSAPTIAQAPPVPSLLLTALPLTQTSRVFGWQRSEALDAGRKMGLGDSKAAVGPTYLSTQSSNGVLLSFSGGKVGPIWKGGLSLRIASLLPPHADLGCDPLIRPGTSFHSPLQL